MSTNKKIKTIEIIEDILGKSNQDLDKVLGMIADDPTKEWLVNEIIYAMEHIDKSIEKLKLS